MKVKVDNQVYDADKTPVMLIFENDAERQMVARHLTDMAVPESIDDMKKPRKYCMYPSNMSKTAIAEFMEYDGKISGVDSAII